MEIPIGRLRLSILVSRAADRRKGWEEMVAVGMDDLELARLNQANERLPDDARWEGLRLVYGGHKRR
jgi:hypothetical protein